MMKWFHGYRHRGKLFEVECERVSFEDILEVQVTKGLNQFEVEPRYKATSLGIPLCPPSAHAFYIHSSWPVGQIRRIRQLSNTDEGFQRDCRTVLKRFDIYQTPSFVMGRMKDEINNTKVPRGRPTLDDGHCNMWLVLTAMNHSALLCGRRLSMWIHGRGSTSISLGLIDSNSTLTESNE
jgi:hypothetical protein